MVELETTIDEVALSARIPTEVLFVTRELLTLMTTFAPELLAKMPFWSFWLTIESLTDAVPDTTVRPALFPYRCDFSSVSAAVPTPVGATEIADPPVTRVMVVLRTSTLA